MDSVIQEYYVTNPFDVATWVGDVRCEVRTERRVWITSTQAEDLRKEGWKPRQRNSDGEAGVELPTLFRVSGTSYTTLLQHNGLPGIFTNGSAIAVTLDRKMPEGYSVAIVQDGAGQITFAAESGATVQSAGNRLKSGEQYGSVTAMVISNVDGRSAAWRLLGNTAA